MCKIYILLLLFLIAFTPVRVEEEDEFIWFTKPITNQKDALEYNQDTKSNIARCRVRDNSINGNPDPELYVVVQEYTLKQLVKDVGEHKKLNLIFTKLPILGWDYFYDIVKGQEERILIEYTIAAGPTEEWWGWKPLNESLYHPDPTKFHYTIFSFHEEETQVEGVYTKMMLREGRHSFEFMVSTRNQWLRLNAFHIKNMKDAKVERYKFRYLRDRTIIYQNCSGTAIYQEDVLGNLEGFEPEDIIWENVIAKNPVTKTTAVTGSPTPSGKRKPTKSSVGKYSSHRMNMHVIILLLWFSSY